MKTNVLVNFILMTLAWNLFLNNCPIMAILVSVAATILLAIKMRKLSIVRMFVTFIAATLFFTVLIVSSKLGYYYTYIHEFGMYAALNISFSNEMIQKTGGKLRMTSSIFSLVMIVFFLTAVILPDSWYVYFTKNELFALISFIFVPYEISLITGTFAEEIRQRTVLN